LVLVGNYSQLSESGLGQGKGAERLPVSSEDEAVLRRAYDAFNDKDIDNALLSAPRLPLDPGGQYRPR
jgi:hypothetical protein